MNKPYEGLFISIEGGEGAGKSTLSEQLALRLEKRGYKVEKTREPGGSPLSEHIRHLLLDPDKKIAIGQQAELFLFLAARAQHVEERILPALRQGKVVICERFNDSTIAYQGCARHLGMHHVEQLCKLICGADFEPNCTFFLDLDPAEGMKRIRGKKADRLEQEQLQFHREVRQGFLHLADQHPDRIVILDASSTVEQVVDSAIQALESRLHLNPTQSYT
ncbi:MAG: dTMP kinase [Chlamydiales bacterium]